MRAGGRGGRILPIDAQRGRGQAGAIRRAAGVGGGPDAVRMSASQESRCGAGGGAGGWEAARGSFLGQFGAFAADLGGGWCGLGWEWRL